MEFFEVKIVSNFKIDVISFCFEWEQGHQDTKQPIDPTANLLTSSIWCYKAPTVELHIFSSLATLEALHPRNHVPHLWKETVVPAPKPGTSLVLNCLRTKSRVGLLHLKPPLSCTKIIGIRYNRALTFFFNIREKYQFIDSLLLLFSSRCHLGNVILFQVSQHEVLKATLPASPWNPNKAKNRSSITSTFWIGSFPLWQRNLNSELFTKIWGTGTVGIRQHAYPINHLGHVRWNGSCRPKQWRDYFYPRPTYHTSPQLCSQFILPMYS